MENLQSKIPAYKNPQPEHWLKILHIIVYSQKNDFSTKKQVFGKIF